MRGNNNRVAQETCVIAGAVLLVTCALAFSGTLVLAQGGGGGGSGGGNNGSGGAGASTQGTASQSENQGGTQDQNTIEIQNRNQEQIQDPTSWNGDVPVQNQEQEQVRVEEREQIRTTEGLRAYINAQGAQARGGGSGATNTEQNRMQIATKAMVAAQHLVGQYGNEFAGIGQQLGSSTQLMLQVEEQIRTRSRLTRFLFGGDKDSADIIREQIRTNTERIERLREYLNDCECDGEVREMLQEQIRNMEMEQSRLQQVAEDEETTWGLFSWRF